MKKIALLLLVTIVFSVYSCFKLHEDENHHFIIHFENRWDKPIVIRSVIDWYWYDNPYDKYHSLFNEEPIPEIEMSYKIQPGCIDSELMKHNDYYEYDLGNEDTVVISIFDANHPDMKDSECFLVRYYLSKENLQKANFHICYPPIDVMKEFCMKPSYDEVIRRYQSQ